MLRRYTFWLWSAVVFQLLTALIHATSLFIAVAPQNDTEKQLETLMSTYQLDAGGGFHPTMSGLFVALSSYFSFVCLLGGLSNGYLLKKKVGPELMKGIVLIDLVVFGGIFGVMAVFTFLPPIICTGAIFVCLLFSAAFLFAFNKQNHAGSGTRGY